MPFPLDFRQGMLRRNQHVVIEWADPVKLHPIFFGSRNNLVKQKLEGEVLSIIFHIDLFVIESDKLFLKDD